MAAGRAARYRSPVAAAVARERRAHPRVAVAASLRYAASRSFPRSERGSGQIADLGFGGARIEVDRPLRIGQWLRLEIAIPASESLRMPVTVPISAPVCGRVVRAIDPADGCDDRFPHAFGLKFLASSRDRLLHLLDAMLPWLSLLFIGAVVSHALYLRGHNLYYFWYHPVINTYGLLITGYIVSRVALACLYRPPPDAGYLPSVSVIVACKNEEGSIRKTLDCIFRSEYPPDRLDVIVVDDGSSDGTFVEMERAKSDHPGLELIRFERNRGKRHAMAAGARKARGDILVYVDSDSFLRRDAIRKLVQGFADPEVGAVCGHAAVENADRNILTRMQEVRYYVAFRIVKAAESLFSAVTCCSGCLSAYRRTFVMESLDAWLNQRFLGAHATFGDDRSLTNFMLRRRRVLYHSEAACSTIVPESLGQFFRQQLRWKKSWIRESLLASMFMWKRHPVAAFFFYLGVVFPMISPIVVSFALVFPAFGLGTFSYLYVYGLLLMALLYGLIYLVRYKNRLWFYGLAFSFFYMLVLVWQTYYAVATVRRNHWGTR